MLQTARAAARAQAPRRATGRPGCSPWEIRSTGERAGFTGLSVPTFLPEVLPAVEVGWRLGRSHWGQGLATEAAAAAVRFGFRERGLERIVSIAQVGNDASERIMTKLGMHPVRDTVNPSCGRRVRVFQLSSDRYAATARCWQ
ncbi:GNAT family N-acetyltransferase [Streptomyces sp. NPDC016675]|uniref:GNAT family N-acetyltransferase n=1 Tax=Streptomyces sp. NPDC016675 TaxID=3364970 RepID=UPI0036FCBA65